MRIIDYLFFMAYRTFRKKDSVDRSIRYLTIIVSCLLWPISLLTGVLLSNMFLLNVTIIPPLGLYFISFFYFNYRYNYKDSMIKMINNYKGKGNLKINILISVLLFIAGCFFIISTIWVRRICDYYNLAPRCEGFAIPRK